MIANTDIDIDFADRDAALNMIKHIPALQSDDTRHKTSVYFQNIPINPITEIASLHAKQAADYGYFKIDFLNNSIYTGVKDESHLISLMTEDLPWDLFQDKNIVENLNHIHNYFSLVKLIKPKSIDDLAIIIALIRPGKKYLVGKDRATIDAEIWLPVLTEEYTFKKSHAYAYAASIIVQLNLMLEMA